MAESLPKHFQEASERVAKLHQRAGYSLLHQQGLLPDTFEELHTTVEELRVAEEEMRVQNEELLRTRQRVEDERHRYQDLFQFAPDAYLVTTLDGKILEANQAASVLLGIAPRFLKSRSLGVSVAPEDLGIYSARLQALAASSSPAQPQEWTLRLRRRHAGVFPAAVTAAPVAPIGEDEPATVRWLIRDITERRQAEEERLTLARDEAARAESETAGRRVTTLLETISDQFVTLDRDWRFTYFNASAARLIRAASRDPDALMGEVIWDAFPTALGTAFQTEALRATETRQVVEFEEYSRGLGRWLQVRIFPSDDGVVVYSQDVTARKEAEAAQQTAFERERYIAATLQRLLLHTVPSDAFPHLSVETRYEAASDEAVVGGDFFDIFALDDSRVALAVGDVSGKGLAAATLTAEIKYALRVFLREQGRPALALARLNDFVCEAQRLGDFDGDRPVVLSLATVDTQTGEVALGMAGGEPLLLLRVGGETETIGTEGLLLGIQPGVSYAEQQATLGLGDTLLMFTDGLPEARQDTPGSPTGALLDASRLAEIAAARPTDALPDLADAILDTARTWAGGTLQDDACLLLARRRE